MTKKYYGTGFKGKGLIEAMGGNAYNSNIYAFPVSWLAFEKAQLTLWQITGAVQIPYSDITKVSTNKLGYIYVHTNSKNDFSFLSPKVISLLIMFENKRVLVEWSNIKYTKFSIYLYILIISTFISVLLFILIKGN